MRVTITPGGLRDARRHIGEIDLDSRLGPAKSWCALSLPGVIARGHRKAGQRT